MTVEGDGVHGEDGAVEAVSFDVVEVAGLLMSHSRALLPIDAAGVMLEDQEGALRVLAASSEETRLLELLELQNEGGPGLAAFTSRQPVFVPRLSQLVDRWPVFVREAERGGLRAAHAFPLRANDLTIGALTLFSEAESELSENERGIAHALASMSTIGIMNHHTVRHQGELTRQLQRALDSRVVIEQAKGIIAVQQAVDVDTAFQLLRNAARSAGRTLPDLSADVVTGRVPLTRQFSSGRTRTTTDRPGSPNRTRRKPTA